MENQLFSVTDLIVTAIIYTGESENPKLEHSHFISVARLNQSKIIIVSM